MGPVRRPTLSPLALVLLLGLGVSIGSRPSEAQRPAPGAASPTEAATPRLVGVVIAEDGRGRAYLQDGRTGSVRAYEVGEAVGDARVVAIEPDRVVLDRSGSRIDLRFGGSSSIPVPPPAPTGVLQPEPEPGQEPAAQPEPAAGAPPPPPAPAPPAPAPPAADAPAPTPAAPGVRPSP